MRFNPQWFYPTLRDIRRHNVTFGVTTAFYFIFLLPIRFYCGLQAAYIYKLSRLLYGVL